MSKGKGSSFLRLIDNIVTVQGIKGWGFVRMVGVRSGRRTSSSAVFRGADTIETDGDTILYTEGQAVRGRTGIDFQCVVSTILKYTPLEKCCLFNCTQNVRIKSKRLTQFGGAEEG